MQSLTKEVFKLAPPGGLFDETVSATCILAAATARAH